MNKTNQTTRPPAPGVEQDPPTIPGRSSSRGRAVAFRLVAVLFPLLLLLFANLVLYWLGVGYDTRVVIPVTEAGNLQTFCFNEDSSMAYFDLRELAGPDPQPFQLPRPADTYRIVFFGASTVEGFPYYTELAFPRQVQQLLSAQMPHRRIEVLNAAIVGINSFALSDFVPRALQAEPDLIVIYAGHNEFYGPGGVGSTATSAPALYGVTSQLRRWRLFQTLRKALRGTQPPKPLLEALPKDLEIRWDSPQVQAAERYYRQHLTNIAQAAEKEHVALLFCSVASNLSAQAPVRSIPNPALSALQAKNRDRLLENARGLLDQQDPATALRVVEQAGELDPEYALVAYRRAECLTALGNPAEARVQYSLARDRDGCRFRAPSSFAQIVRQVATAADRQNCHFLDLEQFLADRSQEAAPGRDFFLEHVHFNFEGHQVVAQAVAQAIMQQVLGLEWHAERVPSHEQIASDVGLTVFDSLEAVGHAMTVLCTPPFRDAPDSEQNVDFLNELVRGYCRGMPPADQILYAELEPGLRQLDMINALAARYLQRGEDERALEMFRCAQRRRPWEITPYVGLAKSLMSLGRAADALISIDQALQLAPENAELREIRQRVLRAGGKGS